MRHARLFTALAIQILFCGGSFAEQQNKSAAPHRPAQTVRSEMPGQRGPNGAPRPAQGFRSPNAVPTFQGRGTAPVGSAEVGSAPPPTSGRLQFSVPTSTAAKPIGTTVRLPSRISSAKPPNVIHNPEHRVGRIGAAHAHRAFIFARDGHPVYRRYYLLHGEWYWYDDPVPDGDPAFVEGSLPMLPVCDKNADSCEGAIVPLADEPAPDVPISMTPPGSQ